MNEKESQSPIEELKKQFREIFGSVADISFRVSPIDKPDGKGTRKSNITAGNAIVNEEDEALRKIKQFSFKPKEIKEFLDIFVIKQDEAKKVLSVAVCDHYNHVCSCLDNPGVASDWKYSKQNILLLGPTGVGKTYLIQTIAKMIGVPFVKADATKFSETGYVGGDVDDLVRDLVKGANGNTELAQYGIIYIDEIDKIATTPGVGRDISGRGVQINLLKLMEETEVNLFTPSDMMSQVQAMLDAQRGGKPRKKTISTKHILFIVSGAFDKLPEAIKRRVEKANIGFNVDINNKIDADLSAYLQQVNTQDLVDYGFEPEFIGRLPVRVACSALNKNDLAHILVNSKGSILLQYKNDFKGYQIEMKVTPGAINKIAALAEKERTGARGLMTVLERILREFKFELPSTAIAEFTVTADVVNDPRGTLKKLERNSKHHHQDVLKKDLLRYAEAFYLEHNLKIEFSHDATKLLVSRAIKQGRTIHSICHETFKDLGHGLKIIANNIEQRHFVIDAAMVEDAEKELSRLVVESFKNDPNVPSEPDANDNSDES